MIIREFDVDRDALAILEAAKDFATRTPVPHMFPDSDDGWITILSQITKVIDMWVAEHNGEVVGAIGIAYLPWIWNRDYTIGEEQFWWTAESAPYKTAILLIQHALAEIDSHNAIPMFKSMSTSPDGIKKVYNRNNMVEIERMYMRA